MALTMQEKRHVGREVALRYLRARRKEKRVMLQGFCATTRYRPPYAAYLLRTYAKRVILRGVTLVPTRPPSGADSGSEFMGDELKRSCDAHGIRLTRSLPWHKNDNYTVESKNWTLVRRCLGYRRFDTEDQLADLRQLRDAGPISLQRDIRLLQARLLGKASQDTSLGAVTHRTISL